MQAGARRDRTKATPGLGCKFRAGQSSLQRSTAEATPLATPGLVKAADRRVVAHGQVGRSLRFRADKSEGQTASVAIKWRSRLRRLPAVKSSSRRRLFSAWRKPSKAAQWER